jgi:SOS-response transcriptional repressor LexA
MSLGKRLRLLRTQKGLTHTDIARHFDITRQTYSAWESDVNVPRPETLIELANFFNVDVDYLLTGEIGIETRKIPLISVAKDILGEIEVPQNMVADGNYFAFIAPDESMSDAGIRKNYIIIVKRQSQIEDGHIAVVYTDVVMIRRVYQAKNRFILLPANPQFKTQETDKVTILGKARYCWFEPV